MENGPYRPRADHQLDINPYSWHTYANVLFIDQPAGTGFSYAERGSGVHDIPTAAKAIRIFLGKFFKVFPEYEQSEVYLAGESYAGVYIPYIARELVDASERPGTDFRVNLAGLAFGNGWVDGYMHVGARGKDMSIAARNLTRECDLDYKRYGERIKFESCDKIFDVILNASIQMYVAAGNKTCLNIYDKRLRDPYPECGMAWPPILPHVYSYLKAGAGLRKDVVKAIHAEGKPTQWTECDNNVMTSLNDDRSKSSHLVRAPLARGDVQAAQY
ncbi:Alpha/Beta hydrolase protein [Syncephalis pseudoplumigaleata]|uniref:Carboxypeptidase n=1 Tax=Syncephalis pseudoplumigaleata TaxID=1712513 RepID=A0A4P9Z5A2_9FUNG|nr:Alpha/Beta hydrolase protein [Syncephalis pseudoplumigaleata]|eukprot:RKP27726.1 Alpha/Beta hydrolase protein [Syncephalis pseudoplumigaleata]